MFDGPTTSGLRLDGPLVVLDLSAVYHSPALGVLMACAAAWLQNAVRAQHRNRIILVVDEAWAILSNLGLHPWRQTVDNSQLSTRSISAELGRSARP